jgi:hypothetical protein
MNKSTRHLLRLRELLAALEETRSILGTDTSLSTASFKIGRKIEMEEERRIKAFRKPAPTYEGVCSDCGRKASICVNTISKCKISPTTTEVK